MKSQRTLISGTNERRSIHKKKMKKWPERQEESHEVGLGTGWEPREEVEGRVVCGGLGSPQRYT